MAKANNIFPIGNKRAEVRENQILAKFHVTWLRRGYAPYMKLPSTLTNKRIFFPQGCMSHKEEQNW